MVVLKSRYLTVALFLLYGSTVVNPRTLESNNETVRRVKRIVTHHQWERRQEAYRNRAIDLSSGSVQSADLLRKNLIAVFDLLRQDGGFGVGNDWSPHEIQLIAHLVSVFYQLRESGFTSSSDTLTDYMAVCFVVFNQDAGIIQFPVRKQSLASMSDDDELMYKTEEREDFLRDIMAVFFVVFNDPEVTVHTDESNTHDDSVTSLLTVDEISASYLRTDYAIRLSQKDRLKLPFRGLHAAVLCTYKLFSYSIRCNVACAIDIQYLGCGENQDIRTTRRMMPFVSPYDYQGQPKTSDWPWM